MVLGTTKLANFVCISSRIGVAARAHGEVYDMMTVVYIMVTTGYIMITMMYIMTQQPAS